jgi:DsbC/DsbD-like thiol-disulfide interchange protein
MRHGIGRPIMVAALVGLLVCAGRGDVAGQGTGKRSDSVVKVGVVADKPGADGKQVITVTLAVEDGWHAYANPVGNDDIGKPTTITVEGKKPEDVQIDYPKGRLVQDAVTGNYAVYEGEVPIKVTVRRTAGDSPLKLKVKFEACDVKSKCLPPATVEESVP